MATDSMTVKITPNERGNPMTSNRAPAFQRSKDRASRNADEEHSGQAFLPLRDPGAVVKRDRFWIVAECHRYVVNGVSILEETASKGVAEAVWGRLLFEGASGFERLSKTPPPDVRDGLEAC